jgi:NADPH:quinone reductase-like Zn-dependent oxidoreductase
LVIPINPLKSRKMNGQKMKAIVCTKYGSPDNLQLQEVDIPTPKDNEVLVKVVATTATTADSMMRRADPFISRFFLGFFKPKNPITGTGFAGKVVAVGKKVQKFKVGNQVFGETGVQFSANAEYVSVPENGVITTKPADISYEEAALIGDGPVTSYNFLKKVVNVQSGQKVLINGASGSLGTAAVQLAKYYGAEVTGVCGPSNVQMVKELGADHVIDYTQTAITSTGQQYDLIFDTVGKLSFLSSKKVLSPQGVYLSPVLKLPLLFQMLWTSLFGKKKAKFTATGLQPPAKLKEIIKELKGLIGSEYLKLVISRKYTLAQTPEAHRYIDTGHKRGSVVIMVD